jgi:ribosomal protein S1
MQISISAQTARVKAQNRVERWGAIGEKHHDAFNRMFTEVSKDVHKSASAARALSRAILKLKGFCNISEVRGIINQVNSRHARFRIAIPKNNGDILGFYLIYGEINSRTKAVKIDTTNPVEISRHALQRLIERIEDQSDGSLIDEIFSCMNMVIPWHIAGTASLAKCWPLLSTSGVFIAVPKENSKTTILVTWCKTTQLSKKWGEPQDNLRSLSLRSPSMLEEPGFIEEFIRSFPWMMEDHAPGEDRNYSTWLEKNYDGSIAEITTTEHNEHPTTEEIEIHNDGSLKKLSIEFYPGLNYRDYPPAFKQYAKFNGLVVQLKNDNNVIVGLRNGWIGRLPAASIQRGEQLITNFRMPEIGEEIEVTIQNISYIKKERAYLITLNLPIVAATNWEKIKSMYPKHSKHRARLEKYTQLEYIAVLASGVRGIIPRFQIDWYIQEYNLLEKSFTDITLETIITGYISESQSLKLALPDFEDAVMWRPINYMPKLNEQVEGKCFSRYQKYCIIELPFGKFGILHINNYWGNDLPLEGTRVKIVVISSDDNETHLAGIPPFASDNIFYALRINNDRWIKLCDQFNIGDTIEVQVLFWRAESQEYVVATAEGLIGTIPKKEVDWYYSSIIASRTQLRTGEKINVKIIKIIFIGKKVIFSRKALLDHPLDNCYSEIDMVNPIGGTITQVMNYGCFIYLHLYKLEGLLHKSEMMQDIDYKKGDKLLVKLDSIDLDRRRISLKIPDGHGGK